MTVDTSKTPQKPVALLVWSDQSCEERLFSPNVHAGKKALNEAVLDCEERVQTASPVFRPVVTSVTPADSELD